MRIALVGVNWPGRGENVDFNSRRTFVDYDIVIWDPMILLHTYNPEYPRHNLMDATSYARLQRDLKQHFEEFDHMMQQGKLVVIFVPAPWSFQYDHAGSSGRGARSSGTILELLPVLDGLQTVGSEGDTLEVKTGMLPLKEFGEAIQSWVSYRAFFSETPGKPFMFTTAGKPAATLVAKDNGYFVFAPFLQISGNYPSQQSDRIFDACEALITALPSRRQTFSLPKWADEYKLLKEVDVQNHLGELQKKIASLQEKIDASNLEQQSIDRQKTVFAGGTGQLLVDEVKILLEQIGFTVEHGPEGRDDLILKYGERPCVAEVKGVTKSAGEGDAAQLQKWISGYHAEHGEEPKGLLIINAYKDIPLQERTQPAFPDQMLDFAKRMRQCLITTTQILELALYAREKPDQKQAIADALLSTIGIFTAFENERRGCILKDAT